MIKETRHPKGMINMEIVPFSMVVDEPVRLFINQYIKGEGLGTLKKNHHILIIDMGECT